MRDLNLAIGIGVLVVLLVAPFWPWSRGWGWAPVGILAMGVGTMFLFSLTVVPACCAGVYGPVMGEASGCGRQGAEEHGEPERCRIEDRVAKHRDE